MSDRKALVDGTEYVELELGVEVILQDQFAAAIRTYGLAQILQVLGTATAIEANRLRHAIIDSVGEDQRKRLLATYDAHLLVDVRLTDAMASPAEGGVS